MNYFKLFLSCVLLAGCAKPGLRGVVPYHSEMDQAQRLINRQRLDPPRNLSQNDWQPALDRVVARIASAARKTCSDLSSWNCEKVNQPIKIISDPSINAFVDEQHQISVFSGLLTHAASDEEIASVIAHEYGHIFARHIEKKQQNAGVGILAGAVVGAVVAGMTGVDVTRETMEAGYGIGAYVYSQESEIEADYYAALILENAGVDLNYGKDLLLRLARSSGGMRKGVWDEKAQLMAATHPSNSYRIARWLSVSSAINASRRLSMRAEESKGGLRVEGDGLILSRIPRGLRERNSVVDDQLRENAWDRLLGGLHEGPVRWVNPQNGHSGMLFFKKAKYDNQCRHHCIQVEETYSVQGNQTKSQHWMCKAQGRWVPEIQAGCEEERQ